MSSKILTSTSVKIDRAMVYTIGNNNNDRLVSLDMSKYG